MIIFDCDGVLIDSEKILNAVFLDCLDEIGLKLDRVAGEKLFRGRSMKDCLQIVESLLGYPPPPSVVTQYHQNALDRFQSELTPVDGIKDVLESVSCKICIASSSPHDHIRAGLYTTGLLPYFEGRIFSATDVERGKPEPDLFLYAASNMNTAPEECLVIEDSVPGAKAGISAGMRVYGYAAQTASELLQATGATIFTDMRDLLNLIPSNLLLRSSS